MAPDLAAGSRANMLFDEPPILPVKLQAFYEPFVLRLCPSTILLCFTSFANTILAVKHELAMA